MQKLNLIAGFLTAFLLTTATLFQRMQWPGGSQLLLYGCITLIIAAAAALFTPKGTQKQTRLSKIRTGSGYAGALLVTMGSIFRIQQLESASIQLVLGFFLLTVLFLPLYFYELYSQNRSLEEKVQERTRDITKAMDELHVAQEQLMSAHLQSEQARKKSDELLLNILPAEVAEELKISGSSTARQFDNVTVLFTDFVNFTRASEQQSPQQLINELDTCFKAFDQIISHYRIEKIKTIGDAYLAVAGLPAPDEEHAIQIVKAAIEINKFMRNRQQEPGSNTFDIRMGVHSGSVVAGIVGLKKFAYDIWGDTVNTAARMEQNSEPGAINISETTFNLVKDRFPCTYRGEIAAKNKGPLKMYFVSAI